MNKTLSRALRGFILACALVVGCQAEQRVIWIVPEYDHGYLTYDTRQLDELTKAGWHIVLVSSSAASSGQYTRIPCYLIVFVLESPTPTPFKPLETPVK